MSDRSVNQTRISSPVQRAPKRRASSSKLNEAIATTIAPPMEWYRLTESSRNILNAVITFAAKEEVKEASKLNPDKQRIDYLKAVYTKAHNDTSKGSNFETLETMRDIVQHYQKILQGLKRT
jgi:hypothetical protein